jgi:hypothetical protein
MLFEYILKTQKSIVPLLITAMVICGCSPIMAANRSSYRGDVKVISPGVDRSTVWGELGEPDNFAKTEDGGFEDRYTLDPDAHRTWVKVLTVIFHLGADVVTAFLWNLLEHPMRSL